MVWLWGKEEVELKECSVRKERRPCLEAEGKKPIYHEQGMADELDRARI